MDKQRPRVKICGITNLEDAELALQAGADALGFIFYPPSPRNITIDEAEEIAKKLPPFVVRVGVFVDHDADALKQTVKRVGIGIVQYHGEESPVYCESFGFPYIKSIRMRDDVDLPDMSRRYEGACALLLDTYRPDLVGGTGQVFNWQQARRLGQKPVILAGGINADNVLTAIAAVEPYAIDVCSGVEAQKGRKDPEKLLALFSVLNTLANEPKQLYRKP